MVYPEPFTMIYHLTAFMYSIYCFSWLARLTCVPIGPRRSGPDSPGKSAWILSRSPYILVSRLYLVLSVSLPTSHGPSSAPTRPRRPLPSPDRQSWPQVMAQAPFPASVIPPIASAPASMASCLAARKMISLPIHGSQDLAPERPPSGLSLMSARPLSSWSSLSTLSTLSTLSNHPPVSIPVSHVVVFARLAAFVPTRRCSWVGLVDKSTSLRRAH
jgi:hypothetical protein